jgi:anti-repressor protein
MTELITINNGNIGGEAVQTVNARDLHSFLEIGKDFSSWIKAQIERARLNENRDFVKFTQKGERQILVEYHLAIDAAKHISMMSGTDKGFDVRDYFLECERRAKGADPITLLNDPATMRTLLLSYSEKVLQLEAVNAEMKPKAEFFDAVTGSTTAVDMAVVAKTLNMGIGRNQLFEFLRNKGILDRKNTPYQAFVDRGYFRIVESSYSKPDGSNHVNFKTVVFQKGMDFIRRQYLEQQSS